MSFELNKATEGLRNLQILYYDLLTNYVNGSEFLSR